MNVPHKLDKLAQEAPNQQGTARFTVEAGMLVRKPAKRTLKEVECYHDVEIEVTKSKVFTESYLHVKVKGKVQDVHTVCSKFVRGLEKWNEVEDDDDDDDDDVFVSLGVILLGIIAVVAIAF